MGRFNQGDRFSGGRRDRFDGDRRSGGGDRSDRQMHSAICSECGSACKLPFKPTTDKPVFCSDCFSNKEGGGGNRSDRRPSSRFDSREKKMFKVVCDTCHKDCEVPFSPSSDKPIYCSDCFEKVEKSGGGRNKPASSDQYKKQFEMLNNKLDDILNILSSKAPAKKVVKEEKPIVKKVVEEKAVIKKSPAKKVVKKAVAPKKVVKKAPAKKVAAPKKAVKKTVVKKKK